MGGYTVNGKMMLRVLIVISCLIASLAVPTSSFAETVRVATRENAIREDCRFFSPVVAKVFYGDPLEILLTDGDWLSVRFDEREGCIHKSAVTEKKIKIRKKEPGEEGEGESSEASREEVALAGKGFNPVVEKKFREDNPDLDFDSVDSIEANEVSDETLFRFIVEGDLRQPK